MLEGRATVGTDPSANIRFTKEHLLYLLFKTIYQYKVEQRKEEVPDPTHLNLVLEEAHRYINANLDETKLGNYYIDKLSREGRQFGIGLFDRSDVDFGDQICYRSKKGLKVKTEWMNILAR